MCCRNNNSWFFQSGKGLGINGISDAGLETFKGKLIESLTREVLQNSLDAGLKNGKPVKVKISDKKINVKKIPGYDELKTIFNDGLEFWNHQNSRKNIEFFENGIKSLNQNEICVLKISDYNTTGLRGSREYNKMSAWQSMVLSEGVSNKNGTDGGSYGIGKASLFANSKIQTVFFSTFDDENIKASQGVSKLPSFTIGGDLDGEIKYGKGYYGVNVNEEIRPIENVLDLFGNIRSESGTDIFIVGFKLEYNWNKEILFFVIKNFLLAIYNNLLEIEIQNTKINKDTLPKLLKTYKDEKGLVEAINYYEVLTSKNKVTKTMKFDDLEGEIQLDVNIVKDKANRSVYMSRSNGMKLFDKKSISANIQFNAILRMRGENLNAFFSKMENPAHDDWEADRYDHQDKIKNAKDKLTQLNRWIKDNIITIGEDFFEDEVEIEGLDDMLNEFYDFGSQNEQEGLNENINAIEFKKQKKNIQVNKVNLDAETEGDEFYSEEIEDGEEDINGEGVTIQYPMNDVPTESEGGGIPTPGTPGEGNRPVKILKNVKGLSQRVFLSNNKNKEYIVIVKSPKDLTDVRVEISMKGETTTVKCEIKEAYNLTTQQTLKITNGVMKIDKFRSKEVNKIKFKLEKDYIGCLGVKVYANTK